MSSRYLWFNLSCTFLSQALRMPSVFCTKNQMGSKLQLHAADVCYYVVTKAPSANFTSAYFLGRLGWLEDGKRLLTFAWTLCKYYQSNLYTQELCNKSKSSPRLAWTVFFNNFTIKHFISSFKQSIWSLTFLSLLLYILSLLFHVM